MVDVVLFEGVVTGMRTEMVDTSGHGGERSAILGQSIVSMLFSRESLWLELPVESLDGFSVGQQVRLSLEY